MTNIPLRILFAIGEMSGGGSERQLLGILKRIDRKRFAPHLYLISPGGELLPEVPADVPVSIFWERHRRPRVNWPGRIHRMQVRDMARVIREQRIDLVYDRTYHMTMIAAGATRIAGVPRVSVIVSNPQVDFETNPERFRAAKRWLLRRAYRSAARVVAVSEGTRTLAADYFRLPPEHIQTVYNFVDLERLSGNAANRKTHADFNSTNSTNSTDADAEVRFARGEPDRFHLVAAGRLCTAKGYEHLIDAMRLLTESPPDAPDAAAARKPVLHILGIGPLESSLRERIAAYGLDDAVRLEGFQSNPFAWFRRADLFVLSSVYEGLPNVVIEAMLAGAPVLATDCPSGPREILSGGEFGTLVPPADPSALAQGIRNAIRESTNDPASWRERARAAELHAMETFGPERGIAAIESLLSGVMGDVRRSRRR